MRKRQLIVLLVALLVVVGAAAAIHLFGDDLMHTLRSMHGRR
jgi:hypothetical protein